MYINHTERVVHPLIPFLKVNRPTALSKLSSARYGKYFEPSVVPSGKVIDESWHKRKWDLQQRYQNEIEAQGRILRSIFVKYEATEQTTAVDYLLWISLQWTLYIDACNDKQFEDEGFVRYIQSGLVNRASNDNAIRRALPLSFSF